jgi:C4-dicarboxylate transporter DctM subunit
MGWMLFLSLLILIAMGMPIAVAIGLSSFFVLATHNINLVLIPQRMFVGADSFPLVAVPFFILAGDLLAKGNVSKRLVDFADACVGFIRGAYRWWQYWGLCFLRRFQALALRRQRPSGRR